MTDTHCIVVEHDDCPDMSWLKQSCYVALKEGSLTREPCAQCGDITAEAHHEDYSRPLDVIWLCKKHHVKRHKDIPKTWTPPKMTAMEFKIALVRLGMKQLEVAELLGVNRVTVSRWAIGALEVPNYAAANIQIRLELLDARAELRHYPAKPTPS